MSEDTVRCDRCQKTIPKSEADLKYLSDRTWASMKSNYCIECDKFHRQRSEKAIVEGKKQ